jgi:DNA-binding response OmpR family regulator
MKNHISKPTPFVIAIVEDEEDLRLNVALFLEAQGFGVWTADSAEGFYRQLAVTDADLVIVDLGLPGEDGLSLIAHLNSRGRHAIIAMTARGALQDRIAGLDAGADHYFVKPVDLYELTAAINAVLRKRSTDLQIAAFTTIETGVWRILRGEAVLVTPEAATVGLTSGELRLLECLMNNAEKVISKSQLLELFDQDPENGDFHRIEVLVSRLRAKVATTTDQRLPLRAVFGKGLVFIGNCSVKSR